MQFGFFFAGAIDGIVPGIGLGRALLAGGGGGVGVGGGGGGSRGGGGRRGGGGGRGGRRRKAFVGIGGYQVTGTKEQIAEFKKKQRADVRKIANIHRRNLKQYITATTVPRTGNLVKSPKVKARVNQQGDVKISENFPLTEYNSRQGKGQYAYIVNKTRFFINLARAQTVIETKFLLAEKEAGLEFTPLG